MPTYNLRCGKCGHEQGERFIPTIKIMEAVCQGDKCPVCLEMGHFRPIPMGGTGFQLSQRNAGGQLIDSGFSSRGRCGKKPL